MYNALSFVIFLSCFLFLNCQFLDEMQSFDKDCLGENKFQCMSGGCTEWESWCDGNMDCDDGSDENFCLSHRPDTVLCNATHQFMCADSSHCIPHEWVCNNETDCTDGSDEADCTGLVIPLNSTCKGFKCAGEDKCISKVWVCDKKEDCADGSDETLENCHHAMVSHLIHDGEYCDELHKLPERSYRCVDSSYCLPQEYMCDGLVDCRDGSDEGEICYNWHTQCSNFSCLANNSMCSPDRGGPTCLCLSSESLLRYNYTTHKCDDVDECLSERPLCSQKCHYENKQVQCSCDEGYVSDEFKHLCFANGPEAMLFFTTLNEIKYYKLKSNVTVTVATGVKQAHGVTYDGSYVYWVDQGKGYQSISRAHLEDVEGTKEVLISLGIENPSDIVTDHLGGNFFFSDTERGAIFVCKRDGSACTTLDVRPKNPRFLTVDVYNGILYWADWKYSPLILTASVSGGGTHKTLVDNLSTFATGLTLDAPNGRLYFVDKKIKAVKLDDKKVYTLLEENHHPYSLTVFEHLVYFSDWATNSIQTLNKMHGKTVRNDLLTLDSHVSGLFMYQPVLQRQVAHNPCADHNCSHICLVTTNVTAACVCPTGMRLGTDVATCEHLEESHKQYLIIGSGSTFTRLPYQTLSSLHADATTMSIGHVQAMTMDYNNTLYMYDTKRRTISYINLDEFSIGITHLLIYNGLRNVVDLGYDFATHSLYWLDAGFRTIGVMYLNTMERTTLYRFDDGETPISFCVVPQYGKMIVAVLENDDNDAVHLDSIGLNGEGREHLIMNNLKGPRVTVRYSHTVDKVYVADEGYGTIDVMHPSGSGRENYLALPSASVSTIAVAEFYMFWTDTRSSRLYWSDVHEAHPKIRQVEMSLFSKTAPLFLTTTLSKIIDTTALHSHPCHNRSTCSYICVQSSHVYPTDKNYTHSYTCLCPHGLKKGDNECAARVVCGKDQIYCYHSNVCFEAHELCDGKRDCPRGEDEAACDKLESIICGFNEMLCWGKCIDKFDTCRKEDNATTEGVCLDTEFKCPNESLCLDRSRLCDMQTDCLDGSDERACGNFSCLPTEFMCDSGMCILNSWRCDGESDCKDGTDEMNCATKTCAVGLFQCGNGDCIDLSSRCDGQPDCSDKSDEKDCHDTGTELSGQVECAAWEHACENNKSICLPLSTRCNGFINCPGGTDEIGCDPCSQHGLFQCKTQLNCVTKHALCDGIKQCEDGSDETAEACDKVPRKSPTSHHFAIVHGASECHEGFVCGTGRCLEWRQVCDHHMDCIDGTDEGQLCSKTCHNTTCAQTCRATPLGPQCACVAGYRLAADTTSCFDVDECARDACPQDCFNTHGSYECACHRGYALRADHHSCKATTGNMTVLYVNFNSVLSISMDGHTGVEYHDATVPAITDIDYDVRRRNLYIAVPSAGKVIESNTSSNSIAITNIGQPSKVTVDWVTGNVYFVDSTPNNSWMRVCHVGRERCAKLQRLPDNTRVTALTIDPHSHLLFYCLTVELESTVVSSSLAGEPLSNVTSAVNCSGLAVDSFLRKLYVAQNTGVLRIGYDGRDGKTIISNDPNFESPTGLALFEDHIYFLVANSYKFNRCLLYGSKRCEPFYWRLFEANTFVIKHESVQRDDVGNLCDGYVCSNICVMKDNGAVCVCHNGQLSSDGVCPDVPQNKLAMFGGRSGGTSGGRGVAFSVLMAALLMLAIYLIVYAVSRLRRRRAAPYMEVRFQNAEAAEDATTPVVDFSAAGGSGHEFLNPLQYVRNAWATLNKPKPVGTAGLEINVPRMSPQDTSDTESDIDALESQAEHSKQHVL